MPEDQCDKTVQMMRKHPEPHVINPITIRMSKGGAKFPWAVCNGRVVLGPPDGTHTSDGVPMDSLDWNVNDYWVVDAVDAEGNEVRLTPDEHLYAVGGSL